MSTSVSSDGVMITVLAVQLITELQPILDVR